jgi:hypothetical protein
MTTSNINEVILKQLEQLISQGEIITKPNWEGDNPRHVKLETKDGKYKVVPEEVKKLDQYGQPLIKYCKQCGVRIHSEHYVSKQEKGSETTDYYHKKCHMLKGTTSSTTWNGEIKDHDE